MFIKPTSLVDSYISQSPKLTSYVKSYLSQSPEPTSPMDPYAKTLLRIESIKNYIIDTYEEGSWDVNAYKECHLDATLYYFVTIEDPYATSGMNIKLMAKKMKGDDDDVDINLVEDNIRPYYKYCEYDFNDLFIDLMKLIESTTVEDKGFYFNRSTILQNINNLTIVIEKKSEKIVAFFLFDATTRFIQHLECFPTKQGYGKMIVKSLKDCYGGTIKTYCNDLDVIEFWKKMNVHNIYTEHK